MTELATRDNIVNESFRQFINRSYHKVSIDSICSELGVSKGAVFHYFNSKYDLACESLLQGFGKLWSPQVKQIIKKDTPRERLKQFIRGSVEIFIRNPSLHRLSYELYEEGTLRKEGCDRWLQSYREQIGLATKLYEECGVSDPERRARLLIASLEGLTFLIMSDNGENSVDIDTASRDLIELFVP